MDDNARGISTNIESRERGERERKVGRKGGREGGETEREIGKELCLISNRKLHAIVIIASVLNVAGTLSVIKI